MIVSVINMLIVNVDRFMRLLMVKVEMMLWIVSSLSLIVSSMIRVVESEW